MDAYKLLKMNYLTPPKQKATSSNLVGRTIYLPSCLFLLFHFAEIFVPVRIIHNMNNTMCDI